MESEKIKEIQFDFCVYRLGKEYTQEEAQDLLNLVQACIAFQGAEMGGGFYEVREDVQDG